jgi:hypothetical protein
MVNHNHDDFVDKRLGALEGPEGFAPNVTQARTRLGARSASGAGRWVWKAALATAIFLFLVAFPAARAVAQTGTLSPDTFFHSLHQTMFDVHVFVIHHFWALQDWWNS